MLSEGKRSGRAYRSRQRARSRVSPSRASPARTRGEGVGGVGGEGDGYTERAVTSIAILAPRKRPRRIRTSGPGCVPTTRRNGCASPGPCRPRRARSTPSERSATLSPSPFPPPLARCSPSPAKEKRALKSKPEGSATRATVIARMPADSSRNAFCCTFFHILRKRE